MIRSGTGPNSAYLQQQLCDWAGADDNVVGANAASERPTQALRPFIDEYAPEGGIGAIELHCSSPLIRDLGRIQNSFLILYPVQAMPQVMVIKNCLDANFRRNNHVRVFMDYEELDKVMRCLADPEKRKHIKFSIKDWPERIPDYELRPGDHSEIVTPCWHCVYLLLAAFGGCWSTRFNYLDNFHHNMKFILENDLIPENLYRNHQRRGLIE